MCSQFNTPLFTALVEHAKKNPIQFHIPGHKKGNGMDHEFRDFIIIGEKTPTSRNGKGVAQ